MSTSPLLRPASRIRLPRSIRTRNEIIADGHAVKLITYTFTVRLANRVDWQLWEHITRNMLERAEAGFALSVNGSYVQITQDCNVGEVLLQELEAVKAYLLGLIKDAAEAERKIREFSTWAKRLATAERSC